MVWVKIIQAIKHLVHLCFSICDLSLDGIKVVSEAYDLPYSRRIVGGDGQTTQ